MGKRNQRIAATAQREIDAEKIRVEVDEDWLKEMRVVNQQTVERGRSLQRMADPKYKLLHQQLNLKLVIHERDLQLEYKHRRETAIREKNDREHQAEKELYSKFESDVRVKLEVKQLEKQKMGDSIRNELNIREISRIENTKRVARGDAAEKLNWRPIGNEAIISAPEKQHKIEAKCIELKSMIQSRIQREAAVKLGDDLDEIKNEKYHVMQIKISGLRKSYEENLTEYQPFN